MLRNEIRDNRTVSFFFFFLVIFVFLPPLIHLVHDFTPPSPSADRKGKVPADADPRWKPTTHLYNSMHSVCWRTHVCTCIHYGLRSAAPLLVPSRVGGSHMFNGFARVCNGPVRRAVPVFPFYLCFYCMHLQAIYVFFEGFLSFHLFCCPPFRCCRRGGFRSSASVVAQHLSRASGACATFLPLFSELFLAWAPPPHPQLRLLQLSLQSMSTLCRSSTFASRVHLSSCVCHLFRVSVCARTCEMRRFTRGLSLFGTRTRIGSSSRRRDAHTRALVSSCGEDKLRVQHTRDIFFLFFFASLSDGGRCSPSFCACVVHSLSLFISFFFRLASRSLPPLFVAVLQGKPLAVSAMLSPASRGVFLFLRVLPLSFVFPVVSRWSLGFLCPFRPAPQTPTPILGRTQRLDYHGSAFLPVYQMPSETIKRENREC